MTDVYYNPSTGQDVQVGGGADYSGNAGYSLPDFDYTGFMTGVDSVSTDAWSQGEVVAPSIAGGAAAPSDNGGIAQALGSMWNWFNDPKNDKKSSTIMALVGGALSGIGKQKTADRASKAAMMSAEASQLTAQTNAAADARKAANANGKVNFGLIDTPKFSDKLAVRRARSGAGLMGGIA